MIGVVAACAVARGIVAQLPAGTQLADAGPRFLAAPPAGHPDAPRGDVRYASVFLRPIALRLEDVLLGDALDSVARAAGMHVSVSAAALVLTRPVSLTANHIAVGAALTALLYNAHVDVQLEADGATITLVPRASRLTAVKDRQASGRIEGRVTDATTGQPFAGATVIVDATGYRAATKADGHYAIVNVPGGTYTITARLLGHTPLSKRIGVGADSVTHVDFALTEAAATLEQVVTTAVGDQRRVELGNSIATINADSITKSAPITSLTDVLSGRAPGVEVLESSGVIGSPTRIRIRGLSSMELSNDPIVVVDGVRINSDPGSTNPSAPALVNPWPSPSRLNDLSPEEIASIDVLKGPSAATEYGTDAANGVIVIKTKHGQIGPPRWDVSAEQGLSNVPVAFPLAWYGWGHTTDGSHTPVQCPRTYLFGPTVANGGCAIDSTTTYQPLDHSATSILTTGRGQRYSGQVSGGAQQLRYFVGGSYGVQRGVLQLDPAEVNHLVAQGQPIPGYVRTPNVSDEANLRGRFVMPLGRASDVALSTGYLSRYQRSADQVDLISSAESGLGYRDPIYNGYAPFGLPLAAFLENTASDQVSRFTGGLTATSRPAPWLAAHATVGIDNTSQNDLAFRRPGPDGTGFTFVNGAQGAGYRGNQRTNASFYTVDLGTTVSVSLTRNFVSKSSVGVQYNDQHEAGSGLKAYGLSSNNTFNGAAVAIPSEIGTDAKTLGSYIEQTVGWRDRLFVTAAIREDAGSGFGRQVNIAAYPKVSGSWVVWDTPQQSLRLRAAYGQSGVQPRSGSTLALYSPASASVAGTIVPGDTAVSVANPRLKPERQSELEGGVDASTLGRRLDIEVTYYSKLSRDALVNVTLPYSAGALTEQENIGSVRNYGLEGTITAHMIDQRAVQWTLTAAGSMNQNRLVSLANGARPIIPTQCCLQYRNEPGYPLYGLWGPQLTYSDVNHDGIIEPNEVSESSSSYFVGSSVPTRELTVGTTIGLWDGHLRLVAQIDHRGGFRLDNLAGLSTDAFSPSAAAVNDPHASLLRQARALGAQFLVYPASQAYIEDASFTRFRELSVRYTLPRWLAGGIRAQSASVMLGVHDLALWTHYTGPDPEASTYFFSARGSAPADATLDNSAVPLLRRWMLRLDVGL